MPSGEKPDTSIYCSRCERAQLELSVVSHFINEYNKAHACTIEYVRAGIPPEPDVLGSVSGAELGIEVAHTYHDEPEASDENKPKDAKRILKPSNKPIKDQVRETRKEDLLFQSTS